MIFLTSGKTFKLTIVFWKKYNMDNAFFVQKKKLKNDRVWQFIIHKNYAVLNWVHTPAKKNQHRTRNLQYLASIIQKYKQVQKPHCVCAVSWVLSEKQKHLFLFSLLLHGFSLRLTTGFGIGRKPFLAPYIMELHNRLVICF